GACPDYPERGLKSRGFEGNPERLLSAIGARGFEPPPSRSRTASTSRNFLQNCRLHSLVAPRNPRVSRGSEKRAHPVEAYIGVEEMRTCWSLSGLRNPKPEGSPACPPACCTMPSACTATTT